MRHVSLAESGLLPAANSAPAPPLSPRQSPAALPTVPRPPSRTPDTHSPARPPSPPAPAASPHSLASPDAPTSSHSSPEPQSPEPSSPETSSTKNHPPTHGQT